jgi:hypothetical protein
MGDYYHEAIYIKSDDRTAMIKAIDYDIWGRLIEPEKTVKTKGYLHLSHPVNGWMQLYYRRPNVHYTAVNSADKVLDYAWRAFTFAAPAIRAFEDEEGSYNFNFSIGGQEFINITKSSMRRANWLNQVQDINEEWHNHPFTLKVGKMLDRYIALEKAIIANQSKISMMNWNYKKHGSPPSIIVDISRQVFLKGFGEWEEADFEKARMNNAQKVFPRERSRKNLEHLGREAEKAIQVPYYWESEEDIAKLKI